MTKQCTHGIASTTAASHSKFFLRRKAYLRSRPAHRSRAAFRRLFGGVPNLSKANIFKRRSYGNGAVFGDDGVEYAAFIGLRHDEMHRVAKVRARNAGGAESDGHEGEHVYMPLSDMVVAKDERFRVLELSGLEPRPARRYQSLELRLLFSQGNKRSPARARRNERQWIEWVEWFGCWRQKV